MTVGTGSKPISKDECEVRGPVGYGEDPMRQLLLCKWERDAPDAGPTHCALQYTRPCGRVKCYLWSGVTFVNPHKAVTARLTVGHKERVRFYFASAKPIASSVP
jgi:hypothetical protein